MLYADLFESHVFVSVLLGLHTACSYPVLNHLKLGVLPVLTSCHAVFDPFTVLTGGLTLGHAFRTDRKLITYPQIASAGRVMHTATITHVRNLCDYLSMTEPSLSYSQYQILSIQGVLTEIKYTVGKNCRVT